LALADGGRDQLPQQVPGLNQSFVSGRSIRGTPTEVRERHDETAIGIALDLSRIVRRHCKTLQITAVVGSSTASSAVIVSREPMRVPDRTDAGHRPAKPHP